MVWVIAFRAFKILVAEISGFWHIIADIIVFQHIIADIIVFQIIVGEVWGNTDFTLDIRLAILEVGIDNLVW